MPAVSRNQAIAMAIAKTHPEQLYARNRGMLDMSQRQLSEFASTSRQGLPAKAGTTKQKMARVLAGYR